MDSKVREARIMPIICDLEGQKEAIAAVSGDEKNSESESLLAPQNTRRKVHWKDNHGNKLAEVLEFQPSDASDGDEDDGDPCFCTIM